MMNLKALGEKIVNQYQLNQAPVVVAVSTGVDSTVLVNALLAAPYFAKEQLIIAHVNHQLRPQSMQEEEFLRQWCANRQLKLETTKWPQDQHPDTGVEAAARRFRYDFFAKVMYQYHASTLLTAHNATEQAESFVMQMIRGGWLSQLRGIPEERNFASGRLVRPFLKISKPTLVALAQQNHLTWFEDETNQQNDFLRNRVRNQILPALQAENPRVIEHIGQYQSEIAEETQLIAEISHQKLDELRQGNQYRLSEFKAQTRSWQKQLIKQLTNEVCPEVAIGQNKLDEVLEFINQTNLAQGAIDLGNGYILEITYDLLQIIKKKTVKSEQAKKRMVTLNKWLTLDERTQFRLSDQPVTEPAAGAMILSSNQLKQPLFVRQATPEDRLRLKNGKYKSVRRELIDQKIPRELRADFWAVVDGDQRVLWVLGLRQAWLAEPYLATQTQYILEYRTGGRPHGQ
ncbi:tRNA lysidine(34) synthetase TilS [Pediococcus acidilactici]